MGRKKKSETEQETVIESKQIGINRNNNTRKILKIIAYTPIAKPLNGGGRGSANYLLKLDDEYHLFIGNAKSKNKIEDKAEIRRIINEFGVSGKVIAKKKIFTYHIKGLRGAIRHVIMLICMLNNLDVCHTTSKFFGKTMDVVFHHDSFHPLGSCLNYKECIIHSIFGSMGNRGKISIQSHPITNNESIPDTAFGFSNQVQPVHIATENRHCSTFDGKVSQDFSEHYFSGTFCFDIDVTELEAHELGLVIDAVSELNQLGRGFNSNYGKVVIKNIALVKQEIKTTWKLREDNSFIPVKENSETKLNEEFVSALEQWENYISTMKGVEFVPFNAIKVLEEKETKGKKNDQSNNKEKESDQNEIEEQED